MDLELENGAVNSADALQGGALLSTSASPEKQHNQGKAPTIVIPVSNALGLISVIICLIGTLKDSKK